MPSYAAYGLGIDSEFDLPELPPVSSGTDIVIRRGAVERPPELVPNSDDYVRLDDDTVVFELPHGRFRIVSAREITVEPSPDSTPISIRLALLGRTLGAVLQWRGLFVLHASAVERDGVVIAFAGESGAGKSTAAAAHLQEGWRLVADDLVAVDLRTAPPTVLTAYPQVKLWPDAAGALGLSVEGTERVHERHEKRILSLDRDRIARSRLSLNAVYVLSQGSSNLQRLEAQDALVEILRHSYAPRIMRVLERQAEHLGQCAALAAAAPISRLVIDRSHQGHSEVVALVERDLRADKPVAPGHSRP